MPVPVVAKFLRKRSKGSGKREEREFVSRETENVRVRSVLVSVGFGLLLHGAVVFVVTSFTPGLSIMRVPAPFLLSSLAVIPACMLRLCSCVDVCVVGKIRNFKQ